MRKQLIIPIVVLAGAMVVSTMARAAGETKNQAPFTRPAAQAQIESRGEAKNDTPFTQLVGREHAERSGEAKNDLPFTAIPGAVPDVFERYASAHPYGRGTTIAVSNADGVEWPYVLGGSAIGGVVLLIGLVGLQSRRRSHSVPVVH